MTTNKVIPEAALSQHIAVLGKTRSGKSSVMRGLVEGLLERQQPVCIVDPKGDWWGIKLGKDGKRPGYPVVIFGGEHADVPINAHAGAHVAELFATDNRPCLIDLGGWMVGERTRFWIDFASTLFKLTKGMRWLVVDEVHNFCPKGKIMDPDSGKALHWTNRLASEGLGKGLHMIIASQRPQKVHNDTLTSAETLIAMRVLHPSDRGAVSDWIKGCGDEKLGNMVLNSLAQMGRGEGWAWSPEIGFGPERVKFPMFKTYDSFRPQTAEDAKSLKGWAEVDLDDVKAKLATVVKEAEANNPAALRKRIAELERDAKKLATVGHTAAELNAEYVRGREEGFEAGRGKELQRVRFLTTDALAHLNALSIFTTALVEPHRTIETTHAPMGRPAQTAPTPIRIPRAISGDADTSMVKAERLALTALAQYPNGRSAVQIAVITGYAVNGGGFRNALGALRTKGFITGGGDLMLATDAGISALGSFDPLPAGDDLRQHWYRQLGKAERKALETLAEVYPGTLSVAQIANRSGYEMNGGGFRNALGRLRTLELIKGRAEISASADLFS